LSKLQDGDIVRVDAQNGTLDVLTEGVDARAAATPDLESNTFGVGREMFEVFRANVGPASFGAGVVV
jgi:phosphogluconate dehydratase